MATSDTAQRTLSLERVESVPPGATVRHVDQLDEPTLSRFLDLLEARRPTPNPAADLEHGDVVVFTDYYRVTVV